MKFIILTQYYPPETGAPQNRLSDLARRLSAAGHEVTVLTAKPNYPRGEIHDDYRGGLWKERRDGSVRVIHCWLYPSRSKRVVLRLLNYVSFVASSAVIGALKLRRADFLLVESPPLFLGWTAWFLSRLKRAAMIFNVSDLYPETAVSLGYLRPGRALEALFALEAWCYKRSMLVTGQTEGIVEDIRRRFPRKEVHLLTNGVDVSDFSFTAAPHGGPFTVGYAGILGHAQALPSALEAARLLKQRGVPVRFAFYGDGPLR
ncbi:MAG TPA: glycosyltransferase family 4 protein, partial [Thermoanaerobaculia bacterium]